MAHLGFSLRRWLVRRRAEMGASALLLAIAGGGGCAANTVTGVGGTGGASTTSAGSSTSATTSSGGGMGGMGTTSSTTSTTTTSSTTSATSSATSTTSAGTGGSGGGFTPPVGTPDYPAEMEQNNLKSTANPLAMGTKGFTASIYPTGDVDVFTFTVTQPGASVEVKTSDGMGGCPAGAHTLVRVTSSNGTVLANDPGAAGCVDLSPVNDLDLTALAAGTYFVHVESGTGMEIPFYVLDIEQTAPGCGDHVVQVPAGEQCDDGNNVSGDGCSATCQLENGPYLFESEPNNTQATGNLLDGYAGAVGQITPLGDDDWYTFHVDVAGSSVVAQTSDGFNGCPPGFDSKIYLYDAGANLLASDDQNGVSPCSKISPVLYPKASNLAVGTYAIKVERYNNASTVPFYVLKLRVAPPGCGDFLIEAGEQCDDGNNVSGDGCSATCQLEGDFIPETEMNNTQALANPLGTHAGFIASINPANDVDFFSFQVTQPGSLAFLQVGDGLGGCPGNFDSKLTLYDAGGNVLISDDDGGPNHCSRITPQQYTQVQNLMPGTYAAKVEFVGGISVQQQYVLTIQLKQPGCGDNVVETGEQCDDGNTVSGDGCSSTCQAEPPWEIEPNNSTATANALWPMTSTWKGSISPLGDHDYFTFTLPAAGTVTLVTHNQDNPTVCDFDTVLHLLDHNGMQITQDDDGGPGPGDPATGSKCSLINRALQAGTYYAWVQRFGDQKTIAAYQLDFTVQ